MNLGAEPPSIDSVQATDNISFDVIINLMAGLTQYRSDLSCSPCCAESWDIEDSGKRYVFHLRKNIAWSDGKTLTAHDFEFAWKRLLDPKVGAPYAFFLYDIVGAHEYNTGKLKDANQLGIKVLDDYTLEVRLKKPAAYFIYLTAFSPTVPQRKDVVERYGALWTEPEHIVTNGPFLLKDWQHEYKIELVANPNYFEGKPHLDRIKMFMIPEQSTAFALYQNNELDYIDNRSFPTSDVESLKGSSEYRNFPLLRNYCIGFNIEKKPFDNFKVRRAISMAIDRSVFPRILRRNEKPSDSWIPPALAGYKKSSGQGFDPPKAQALLAEAGYPQGKGFPQVTVLFPAREDAKLVMEAIQDELKRNLNIHIELVSQEWKVYRQALLRDPPPMFRDSWGADYPDAETFMNIFMEGNGNNHTRWHSKRYDQIVQAAEAELDGKKRAALYAQADAFLCREETPIVPTFLASQNLLIKPWVTGISCNPLDIQFLKDVSLNSASTQTTTLDFKSSIARLMTHKQLATSSQTLRSVR
jgi:oligopeptide transport system substrate-binding protein